jgi:hypothetical protein
MQAGWPLRLLWPSWTTWSVQVSNGSVLNDTSFHRLAKSGIPQTKDGRHACWGQDMGVDRRSRACVATHGCGGGAGGLPGTCLAELGLYSALQLAAWGWGGGGRWGDAWFLSS